METNNSKSQELNQADLKENKKNSNHSYIIKIPHRKNFTILSNTTLYDSRLSAKASCYLMIMLSFPSNWKIRVSHLATLKTDGIDAVRSAIKELVKLGYMSFCRPRDSKGKLGPTVYLVSETPKTQEEMEGFKKDLLGTRMPYLDFPHVVNPTLLSTNSKVSTNNKEKGDSPNYKIKLTEDQKNKLIDKMGKQVTEDLIESLHLHLKSVGQPKKYKCHYSTILSWYNRDIKKKNTYATGEQKPVKEIEDEKKLIGKLHSKYIEYRDDCTDNRIQDNCLMVEGDFMLDSKSPKYKTRLTLVKFVDKLMNGGYVNRDSFKNFANKEFKEAETMLKCDNIMKMMPRRF